MKIFNCCICGDVISKNKRLVYQLYDNKKPYGSFHNKKNYDFCNKCFTIFERWIKKHEK